MKQQSILSKQVKTEWKSISQFMRYPLHKYAGVTGQKCKIIVFVSIMCESPCMSI